jgi:hypothetical protein
MILEVIVETDSKRVSGKLMETAPYYKDPNTGQATGPEFSLLKYSLKVEMKDDEINCLVDATGSYMTTFRFLHCEAILVDEALKNMKF